MIFFVCFGDEFSVSRGTTIKHICEYCTMHLICFSNHLDTRGFLFNVCVEDNLPDPFKN